ncbi:hypothetical protein ACOMHN_019120 [Nucella lapillus]
MNFASPYVYNNADDDFEVVSDEEFHEGMELSDSSDSDTEVIDGAGHGVQQLQDSGAVQPEGEAVSGQDATRSDGSKASSRSSVINRVKGFLSSSSSKPPTAQSHSETRASALAPPTPSRSKSMKLHHWKSPMPLSESQGRKFRRADTNILSLRFDTLKRPSTMHAGEVIKCSACEAIMSNSSRIEEDGPDKVWMCEFCGNRNLVDIDEEEKPAADDVTYLIEAALSTTAMGSSGRDESVVVFCIDISGSMTITTEVPGFQKLRGSATLRRLNRENSMEGPQRLPREVRNVTYISRLQAVQAAVDHQLGEMAKEFPHRRIALVTFSSEVCVIGDGTGEVVTVSGQKLTNQEELMKVGSQLPLPKPIQDVRASLGDKIFMLEEGGATALGPAIVVALSLASRKPGSKVILCTDGKSNEGVGKVENLVESDPSPDEFYENVGATANSKGVSVSVITISGTDCKLIQLGKLANTTGGQVNIVDTLKLTEEFRNVLADQIIATSVVATFIVHKDLYIGKEENAKCKEEREIGNVNADHEISFEFGLRRKKAREPPTKINPLDRISEISIEDKSASSVPSSGDGDGKSDAPMGTGAETPSGSGTCEGGKPDTPTDTGAETPSGSGTCEGGAGAQEGGGKSKRGNSIPPELPFQVQIMYTDVDGTKALRVLTQKKPVTKDRTIAEKDLDLNVLALHTERRSSELALMGDYSGSRGLALMNQRLAWRSSHNSTDESRRRTYRRVFSNVQSMENTVSSKQRSERLTYGRTHSDDEDEGDNVEVERALTTQAAFTPVSNAVASPKGSSRRALTKKKKMRSEEVDDSMAHLLYQAGGFLSPAHCLSKGPVKGRDNSRTPSRKSDDDQSKKPSHKSDDDKSSSPSPKSDDDKSKK